MIGQTILHYKIIEKLGEGGMGVVYKAQDTTLDRFVALKFLPKRVEDSEQDRARFLQEARAASALNHPNICTIYGIEEHDGTMFLAMEFVDGQTLKDKKNSVSFKQAIDIGIQVAEGLSVAHEKGVVHRDIKPENIMIRKDGIAQIMDFGLAKLRGVSRITKEGSTVGTAGYMSPEQVQGTDADHRSDIFSLGVLLYELFAGRLPFAGVHETAVMYEIVNVDAQPISTIKPEIDPELDRIVLECLQKEPTERYQSAGDVAKDLRRFKRESSRQHLSRVTSRQSFIKSDSPMAGQRQTAKRWPWPALAVALGIIISFLVWKLWQSGVSSVRPIAHFSINLPDDAPIQGGDIGLSVSPDGKYLAYVAAQPQSPLYLRPMGQYDVERLAGTENATYPTFSPDGQWVAFATQEKIKKISIFGGAPQDICKLTGNVRGMWWGDDSKIYFGHIQNGIFSVSSNGGEAELLTKLDSATGEISHRFPQLLPDGKTLIYTVKPNNIGSFDDALIAAQRIGTSEKKILIRGGTFARYLPTGHLAYVRGNSILGIPFDPGNLEASASPSVLLEGGWLNSSSGDAKYSFTRSGMLAYVPLGADSFNINTVSWLDRTEKLQPVITMLRPYVDGVVSPDGQKIAVTIGAANDDIWVYQMARKTLTRLTFGGGNHGSPRWSVDGKYIFYTAENGQSINICRRSWDGSGGEERILNTQVSFLINCTPDGKNLAYVKDGDIWMLPLEGQKGPSAFIQSPANEGWAAFSPDGNWTAYTSSESGHPEVYVIPFHERGGKWQISSGGGFTPFWSHNGKQLFYQSGNTMMVVQTSAGTSFDFSPPVKYCELPPSVSVWDLSKDDQRFLITSSPIEGSGLRAGLTDALGSLPRGGISAGKINVILEWFQEIRNKFSAGK